MAEQSEKRAFVQRMKDRVDDVDARIDRFEKKVDGARDEVRKEYRARLAEMRAQRQNIRKRMDEMADAGEKRWVQLRGQVEETWKALENSFNSFKSHFRD